MINRFQNVYYSEWKKETDYLKNVYKLRHTANEKHPIRIEVTCVISRVNKFP